MRNHRSVNIILLKAFAPLLLFVCIPANVYGWCPDWWFGCLDTQGAMPPTCKYECKITGVNLEQKTTSRTNYQIVAQCDWYAHGSAACPPSDPKTITGQGWYDNIVKLASENIHNTYSEEFLLNTVSKCGSDPWTGPIDCNEIQRKVISNIYRLEAAPISARSMTDANRTLLQQQVDAATTFIQAPYIFQPVNNAVFEYGTDIPFKIRYLAEYEIALQLQRKDTDGQYKTINDFSLSSRRDTPEGNYKIYESVFEPGSTGNYRIRAACQDEALQWSDWNYFKVDELSAPKFVQPMPGQKFKKLDTIRVEALHPMAYHIQFDFERSPKPAANEWPSPPESIEPLTKICTKLIQDGQILQTCFYTFSQPGIYTVNARYVDVPPLQTFVSVQNFEISEGMSIQQPDKKQLSAAPKYKISSSTNIQPIEFEQKQKRFSDLTGIKFTLANTLQQKLVFDFEYKNKKRIFRHVSLNPAVTLNHINGKSVATFKKMKPGKWRVRARSVKQGNQWSKWYAFSVVGLRREKTISPKPQKPALSISKKQLTLLPKIPVITQPKNNSSVKITSQVSFHIRHTEKRKLSFVFEHRKDPGKGSYEPYSVNVSPLKTRNGNTTGSLSLGKAGEYRFKVKEKQRGAKWSKWCTFKIKSRLRIEQKPKGPSRSIKKQMPFSLSE